MAGLHEDTTGVDRDAGPATVDQLPWTAAAAAGDAASSAAVGGRQRTGQRPALTQGSVAA